MSESWVIACVVFGAIMIGAWWMERERAEQARAWIEIFAENAAEAEADKLSMEAWANAWEERALAAEAKVTTLERRYETLQILYCQHVRNSIAANTWIVMRASKAK